MAEIGVFWSALDDFRMARVCREVALVASVGCGAIRNISWQQGIRGSVAPGIQQLCMELYLRQSSMSDGMEKLLIHIRRLFNAINSSYPVPSGQVRVRSHESSHRRGTAVQSCGKKLVSP